MERIMTGTAPVTLDWTQPDRALYSDFPLSLLLYALCGPSSELASQFL